jgi:pimeloyl-ACP methyl ester carboxylesterase
MGGSIAVIFAARHPERVRTLALFDADYWASNSVVWPIQAPLLVECLACGYIVPSLPDGQRRDSTHPERYPDYFQIPSADALQGFSTGYSFDYTRLLQSRCAS